MNEDFLEIVKNTYNSDVNATNFNDEATVNLINEWVKGKTENKIDKIVEKIDPDTVIYLINALYFEAEWETKYYKENVFDEAFFTSNGQVSTPFLHSDESLYIEDDNAVGFSKPYAGKDFSFVALLPNEDITAVEYLNQLDGEKLFHLLDSRKRATGIVSIPKFKSEFSASLVDSLKTLGIKTAFNKNEADFTKMAISTNGNISISEIMHKTFIEVNETGTKAAAVTSVEMTDTGETEYTYNITFNRPFVYMIIDEETNLPLFIGIMNNPSE